MQQLLLVPALKKEQAYKAWVHLICLSLDSIEKTCIPREYCKHK